jgi:hypothetical protein
MPETRRAGDGDRDEREERVSHHGETKACPARRG